MKPGIYDGIADSVYHADPCSEPSLSSTIARLILDRSPRHAFTAHPRLNKDYEPEHAKQLDFGSVAHAIITGRGRSIEIIDAADFKTKAAREARDAARDVGKLPILPHDFERARAMVGAAFAQIHCTPGCDAAFRRGRPETTLIWREGEAWLRARPDWLDEQGPDGVTVYDYKASGRSCHPMLWARHAVEMGYDAQAAFYQRGILALGVTDRHIRFRFVAQEDEPPFALSIMEFDGETQASAQRDMNRAIGIWRDCMATGIWPAYPPIVHRIAAPAYALAHKLEREVFAEDAAKFSIRAQEPIE
jgi:hypothetical protein